MTLNFCLWMCVKRNSAMKRPQTDSVVWCYISLKQNAQTASRELFRISVMLLGSACFFKWMVAYSFTVASQQHVWCWSTEQRHNKPFHFPLWKQGGERWRKNIVRRLVSQVTNQSINQNNLTFRNHVPFLPFNSSHHLLFDQKMLDMWNF